MTTVDSGSDVWVHDYTTTAGVQVSGHWRKRRPPSPDAGHDRPGTDQATSGGGTEGPHQANKPTPPSPPASPDGVTAVPSAAPLSGLSEPVAPVPAATARVAAAESRYRAARVSAGVSALRRSRGQECDLPAAFRERAEAKAELDAALAGLTQQTPPNSLRSATHQDTDAAEDGPATGDSGADRCPYCGQFRAQDHQCPTPDGLPKGDYSGMKGDERVKAMVSDLESSVKAVVESGQLHRWLDAMASNGLSRWSANNRFLAAVQILQRGEPLDDLHLMGFRQWEKWGRQVSKGAKAVWILAPITRKVTDENEDGTSTERHRVVGFKGVPVFNVSDTHGDPLPESPGRSAPGAATPGTLDGLRDRVTQAGYHYEEIEISDCRPDTGDGTLGYTDPASKKIVVDARLSEAQKASTIAHELGHVHCGHVDGDYRGYLRHRGQMETEAEACAYLTMRARGASDEQAHSFSPGYIAGWSHGDATVIRAAIDKAVRAHNKIMDGTWPEDSR